MSEMTLVCAYALNEAMPAQRRQQQSLIRNFTRRAKLDYIYNTYTRWRRNNATYIMYTNISAPSPQIRLLLTIVRVYKLNLLTYLLTYSRGFLVYISRKCYSEDK